MQILLFFVAFVYIGADWDDFWVWGNVHPKNLYLEMKNTQKANCTARVEQRMQRYVGVDPVDSQMKGLQQFKYHMALSKNYKVAISALFKINQKNQQPHPLFPQLPPSKINKCVILGHIIVKLQPKWDQTSRSLLEVDTFPIIFKITIATTASRMSTIRAISSLSVQIDLAKQFICRMARFISVSVSLRLSSTLSSSLICLSSSILTVLAIQLVSTSILSIFLTAVSDYFCAAQILNSYYSLVVVAAAARYAQISVYLTFSVWKNCRSLRICSRVIQNFLCWLQYQDTSTSQFSAYSVAMAIWQLLTRFLRDLKFLRLSCQRVYILSRPLSFDAFLRLAVSYLIYLSMRVASQSMFLLVDFKDVGYLSFFASFFLFFIIIISETQSLTV